MAQHGGASAGVFERFDRGLMAWHVIVFVLIALGLGAYILLVTVPHLGDISSVTLLDMHYAGFHPEDVEHLLHGADGALTEDGQSYYATSHLIVDLFFGPALFLAISSLFLWLSRPGRQYAVPLPEGVRLVVVSLALAGAIADVIENIAIWVILANDVAPSGVVYLGGTLTGVKFLAYSGALAALAATIILALIRGVSRQEPARA
jgi:hypothetical protein